jgi:hypothetical protein
MEGRGNIKERGGGKKGEGQKKLSTQTAYGGEIK